MIKAHDKVAGWIDKAEKKANAKLTAAQDKATKWAERVQREQAAGNVSAEALEQFGAASDKVAEIKAAITSGAAFVDQGITYTSHMVTAPDFSIAEHCGRFYIDKQRAGFSVDKYHDTEKAETVAEGESCKDKALTSFIDRIQTESAERLNFMDILAVGEGIQADDPDAVEAANASAHNKHIINAENAAILAKLAESKTAVAVDPQSVQSVINAKLCGKAKRGAEIWTNNTGFAALDTVDASGRALVTKDASGNFVYREKYVVREFAPEIMPNTDKGAPVIVGDFVNVVRFAVQTPENMSKNDLGRVAMLDRLDSPEIPILTTTSDEAYFNGYIVAE